MSFIFPDRNQKPELECLRALGRERERALKYARAGRRSIATSCWRRARRISRRLETARGVAGRRKHSAVLELRGEPHELSRRHIEGLLRTGGLDMVVDGARHGVYVGTRFLDMHGSSTSFRILEALARRGENPIEVRDLFAQALGRPCRTYYDCRSLYFHVWKLREQLATVVGPDPILLSGPMGYRLDPRVRVAWIRPFEAAPVSRGDPGLLHIIQQRGFIDNRTYRTIMQVTRSSASNDLARMVEAGVLAPRGAGRGFRYVLAARTA